jgi:DNA repair exonuclease SbcCD ATPase subunit
MYFERVAGELYQLPPAEFTAARDARAAEARTAGDRPAAVAIKALRRPTIAAWLVNWLVRERADDLDRLFALGVAMRSAQEQLLGEQLRQLSRQRHQVVAALAAEARSAGRELGVTLSETTMAEVEATLSAGMADEDAMAVIRTGRLTTSLSPPTGLGPVGPRPAGTGSSGPAPAPPPATSSPAEPEALSPAEPEALSPAEPEEPPAEANSEAAAAHEAELAVYRKRIEDAEQAVRAAQRAADSAWEQAAGPQRNLQSATARRDQLRRAVATLQEELETTTAQADLAETALRVAQGGYETAQETVAAAEAGVAAARRELDRLVASAPAGLVPAQNESE